MDNVLCLGCNRSVLPLIRLEKDKKHKKTWRITYCPYDRCGFNIDIEITTVKLWNNESGYFEDYTT